MVVHIEVLTRASAQHEPSLLCNSVWPNSLIMWFSQIKKIVALLPVLMPESLKCSASTLPLPNVTSNYPLNSARFSSLFGKMGGMSSAKRKSSKCHPQDLSHAVDFQICIRTLRLKCSTELCFCPKSYFFSKDVFPSCGLNENRVLLLVENSPMPAPPVRGSCEQTPCRKTTSSALCIASWSATHVK